MGSHGKQSSPKSVPVSGNPIEEGSLRFAWSCPHTDEILQVEPQGPGEEIAGLGVAIALGRLLSDGSDPGWLPSLFNETVAPLTTVGAVIPSFFFVDLHVSLEQQPPLGVIHQFVMVLVSRLAMSVPQIITAYALVNQALVSCPSLMRCCSVRPIFLASCVVACKVTHDCDIHLCSLQSRLIDVFDLLELGLLVKLEHQLLEVLHWQLPMGIVFQDCADALFRAASDELARRALDDAPSHPTLAPRVLAPWTPPTESPAARFRAAAHIQSHARGMATRSRRPFDLGLASAAITH